MTINGPAAWIFACYLAVAERQGVARERPRRHAADRHLQGVHGAEGMAVPAAAAPAADRRPARVLRARDPAVPPDQRVAATTSGRPARPRSQELAFTLADGFAYVELGRERGLDVDAFAPRLSFFFDAHIDLFEEIAKFRAARRIWARWLRDRYGAHDARGAAPAIPHPDRGRLAHRAAADEQRRAHGGRSARGRARRHAVAPHERAGRGARPPDRGGRDARPADPADHRVRDRRARRSPTRSAGRTSSRRSPTRSSEVAESVFARDRRMGGGLDARGRAARRRDAAGSPSGSPRRRSTSSGASSRATSSRSA